MESLSGRVKDREGLDGGLLQCDQVWNGVMAEDL